MIIGLLAKRRSYKREEEDRKKKGAREEEKNGRQRMNGKENEIEDVMQIE